MHKFQLLSYKTKLLLLEFELLCYHILLSHLNKVHFVLYIYKNNPSKFIQENNI